MIIRQEPDLEDELVDEGGGHSARDGAQPVNPVVRPALARHHGRAQRPGGVHTRAWGQDDINLVLRIHRNYFLAPTGAQGMLMSVCQGQVCLEQSIFIFLGQRAIKEHSESNRAVKKQLESYSRSLKYCLLFY